MSLRKKIIFGFSISAAIIAILAAFEYFYFIQVRNEMRFLEVTDSARNRALQLRRYEKNFFLFPDQAAQESDSVHYYLSQLDDITSQVESKDPQKAAALSNLIGQYREEFGTIETLLSRITQGFENMKTAFPQYGYLVPLVEVESRDNPQQVAAFLQSNLSLPRQDPEVSGLLELDSNINLLRENGENIINAANDLDHDARDNAEVGISRSQIALLAFLPLILLAGLGAGIYISTDVVKRLKTLTNSVEKIGKRYTSQTTTLPEKSDKKDEVDILIEKFKNMDWQLVAWEEELDNKNQELLKSKKLAAIGTLAAGVAHELNNPLNNINISAQVLKREIEGNGSDKASALSGIVDDIVGQTARVKSIVGNLLEFAREREPQLETVNLAGLISNAYSMVGKTMDTGSVLFSLDSEDPELTIPLDAAQFEQVFVNLFTNSLAAIDGDGSINVRVRSTGKSVKITVSDTGRGISKEDREKVFDPFFTRKDKGTGLGLAIVMNTVQKHGGSISVTSEEGMGTIFEIILPKESR